MQITIQTEIWNKRIIVKEMWLFGGGGVNTLGKSFLSSEEIPKCNLTHENTNTTLVPMDIRKIKSSSVVVEDWGKGDTEFLLICLPCTESSVSFSNSSIYSLFSLLLVMYRLFFLCTYEVSCPAELWLSWYLPTCADNITEFLLCTVSFTLPLAFLHCFSLDIDKHPYQVQKGTPS